MFVFPAFDRQSLGARLTSPEVHGVQAELLRLGAGLSLAALYGLALGLYRFVSAVRASLAEAPLGARAKCLGFLGAFCVFAFLLAARIWSVLPILKGGA